jgi:hypothetical protein
MCEFCDDITSMMTLTDIKKIEMYCGAIFNHFVDRSTDEVRWDNAALADTLDQYINDPAIRVLLAQHPKLRVIFCYGGTCALEMMAQGVDTAMRKIQAHTDEELTDVRDALRNPAK